MSRVAKEYELETQITDAMMERWGYARKPTVRNHRKHISINSFDVLDPKTLPRISDPDEPLTRFFYENRNYKKLTENLFKEYNHVVSYKPVSKKQEMQAIRDPQPKSTIEKIQEDIQEVKKEVAKSGKDLVSQFALNNKLNRLFRQYHKTSKQKYKMEEEMQKRALSTHNSNKFREELRYKPPVLNFEIVKERKRAESLLEPFDHSNIEAYVESQKIETKIIHEKEVLELYKSKVEERKKSSLKYNSLRDINEPHSKPQKKYHDDLSFEMYQMGKTNADAPRGDQEDKAAMRDKRHSAFSKILKNKNPKYVKSKGTNFLVRYNQKQQASQLLSGKRRQQDSSLSNSFRQQMTNASQDYDLETMEGPPRKLPDTRDYEAEFRNQKAQASLKSKVRHNAN